MGPTTDKAGQDTGKTSGRLPPPWTKTVWKTDCMTNCFPGGFTIFTGIPAVRPTLQKLLERLEPTELLEKPSMLKANTHESRLDFACSTLTTWHQSIHFWPRFKCLSSATLHRADSDTMHGLPATCLRFKLIPNLGIGNSWFDIWVPLGRRTPSGWPCKCCWLVPFCAANRVTPIFEPSYHSCMISPVIKLDWDWKQVDLKFWWQPCGQCAWYPSLSGRRSAPTGELLHPALHENPSHDDGTTGLVPPPHSWNHLLWSLAPGFAWQPGRSRRQAYGLVLGLFVTGITRQPIQ